ARVAGRHAGGHRGRRPPVRGARVRGDRVESHGQLGHHRQRVGTGGQPAGGAAGRGGRLEGGRGGGVFGGGRGGGGCWGGGCRRLGPSWHGSVGSPPIRPPSWPPWPSR